MKEKEIRPEQLLERYHELIDQDVEIHFKNDSRCEISCVACGCKAKEKKFTKNRFDYAQCKKCGTLYQTPRPSSEIYNNFYKESKSAKFWAETFFPTVEKERREKIFVPRAKKNHQWCEKRKLSVNNIVDVCAGYGIFL